MRHETPKRQESKHVFLCPLVAASMDQTIAELIALAGGESQEPQSPACEARPEKDDTWKNTG
jgi:hypothetical protein